MSSGERKNPRVQNELLVAYETPDGLVSNWAVNVSSGGLFVNTRTPLPAGAVVRLILNLPGSAAPFDLQARVKWVESERRDGGRSPGMGLEFLELDPATRDKLQQLVDTLRVQFGTEGDA